MSSAILTGLLCGGGTLLVSAIVGVIVMVTSPASIDRLVDLTIPGKPAARPASSDSATQATSETVDEPLPPPEPVWIPTVRDPGPVTSTAAMLVPHGQQKSIALPGPVGDVVRGGGDRYLALSFPAQNEVRIFDFDVGELTHVIPLKTGAAEIAADYGNLFIVHANTIEQWSLESGEQVASREFNTLQKFDTPTSGYESAGPLRVRSWIPSESPVKRAKWLWQAIETDTLELKQITMTSALPGHAFSDRVEDGPAQARTSADGRTVVMWRTSGSPSGLQVFRFGANPTEGTALYEHQSVLYAQPDTSGGYIHTNSGVYDENLKRIQAGLQSLDVGVAGYHWIGTGIGRLAESPADAIAIPGLDRRSSSSRSRRASASSLAADRRIHVLLRRRLICTFSNPPEHELVLHGLDPDQLIPHTSDITLVYSQPPRSVTTGDIINYQIEVASGAAKTVTFGLDFGPPGMTITPQGLLQWTARPAADETETTVIVSLHPGDAPIEYHAFVLQIVPVEI